MKSLKDKNVAAILALIFGWAGLHRFYLGQIGLGILYLFLMGTGISFMLSLIDAVAFFVMDKENFDLKYNRHTARSYYRRRTQRYTKKRTAANHKQQRSRAQQGRATALKLRQWIKEGKEKFKDFDYEGAIQAFEQALKIDEDNPAVHFNLGCLYALMEDEEKALNHLDKAVAGGFKDFDRIEKHEALAWLRIQEGFEPFRQNGYRLKRGASKRKIREEEEDAPPMDFLEQLQQLKQLRERGMLTEKEYRRELAKLKR